jgi:hypothetical protein
MRLPLLAVAAALLLAGCADAAGPDPFDPVGRLSFTYRGAVSGAFSAVGVLEPEPGGTFSPVTGAGGYRLAEGLVLAGSVATATGLDAFSLLLGGVEGPGTVALDPTACAGGSAPSCRAGVFLPGLAAAAWSGVPDPAEILAAGFVMIAGEVVVTSISSTRVRGTFRGLAVRGAEPSLANTIAIEGGTFDLPVREPPAVAR